MKKAARKERKAEAKEIIAAASSTSTISTSLSKPFYNDDRHDDRYRHSHRSRSRSPDSRFSSRDRPRERERDSSVSSRHRDGDSNNKDRHDNTRTHVTRKSRSRSPRTSTVVSTVSTTSSNSTTSTNKYGLLFFNPAVAAVAAKPANVPMSSQRPPQRPQQIRKPVLSAAEKAQRLQTYEFSHIFIIFLFSTIILIEHFE